MKFSKKVTFILKMSDLEYERLSIKCLEIANKYKWQKIANNTLSFYKKKLREIRN